MRSILPVHDATLHMCQSLTLQESVMQFSMRVFEHLFIDQIRSPVLLMHVSPLQQRYLKKLRRMSAGTQHMTHGFQGWRLSLGLACVPGLMLIIGSHLTKDTPNSLVYRCPCAYSLSVMPTHVSGCTDWIA